MTHGFSSPRSLVAQALNPRRRQMLRALGMIGAMSFAGALARPARAATGNSVLQGRDRWLFAGWESTSDAALPACQHVLDLIQAASAKLAARKISTVVVVAPLKAAVYANELPPESPLSSDVAARYAALLDGARQRQLHMVDSVTALAPLKTGDDPAYIRGDYHWSAHTAEASAAEAAKLILAGPPLAGSAGSGAKLGRWNEEFHFGDLAELLPPDTKKAIGKDRFVVRSVLSGQSLLADAPSVVQVVGNSMSQPYLGFSQKLSNAIDRPVGLTWSYGDTGPWKTLLNYLGSKEFAARPAQTIVWQFNEGQMMYGPSAGAAYDATSQMSDPAFLDALGRALG